MRGLCIVAVNGAAGGGTLDRVFDALSARGFETFAAHPGDRAGATGDLAIVAFNPLLTRETTPDALFASPEIERTAHLLSHTVGAPGTGLRVTRSEAQAEAVARALLGPQGLAELDEVIAARRAGMATHLPVLADLSRFKYRAKVERIAYDGTTAVLKTFRPCARDALRRELAFVQHIGRLSPVPPRILAHDERSIAFEDIEDARRTRRLMGRRVPVPLPLNCVRELATFVRLACAEGFDAIDLTPRDNVLIDARTGRLRAIDFEFTARRSGPVRPEDSYCLSGVPPDAPVARPLLNAMEDDPYPTKWRPFTGLPKHSFLHDPPWLQHVKRAVLHPFWLAGFVVGALGRRRRHRSDKAGSLAKVAWTAPLTESARAADAAANGPG